MIVYQDRAFCTAKECKHYDECPRAITDRVREEAEKAGLPISVMGGFECFERDDT